MRILANDESLCKSTDGLAVTRRALASVKGRACDRHAMIDYLPCMEAASGPFLVPSPEPRHTPVTVAVGSGRTVYILIATEAADCADLMAVLGGQERDEVRRLAGLNLPHQDFTRGRFVPEEAEH